MEAIYSKMLGANSNYGSFLPDSILKHPYEDERRCYALVTDGDWVFHDGWSNITPLLNEIDTNAWITPQLHHTFLTLHPHADKYTVDWQELVKEVDKIPTYTVTFDRVIPVKTGFVLCGIPSIDINAYRNTLREKGFIQEERYHCDIAHATLIRCIGPVNNYDQVMSDWMGLPKMPYATLEVKKINILKASWCMYPGTYFLALKNIQ